MLQNFRPHWLLPLCANRNKILGIPLKLPCGADDVWGVRTLTGSAALLELVPNARTSALEKPQATSMGFRLLMNQNPTGRITTPKITSPADKMREW